MSRLRVLAFALAMISAVPGEAETAAQTDANISSAMSRFHAEDPMRAERRGFAFPIIEYTDQTGTRQQRKGIIASKVIAPNTLIGVGLFETTPKTRGYWGDVPPNVTPRHSRKAVSVGLNWRF